MAETNSDEKDKEKSKSETVADDDKEVTEEDLRKLKYGEEEVESSQKDTDESSEPEETEEESEETGEVDGQTDDQAEDEESEEEAETESDEDTSEFVKEFPNIKGETPEEYARNLEIAYQNSTAEALRWKQVAETKPSTEEGATDETELPDPRFLYLDRMLEQEMTEAYSDFSKGYPQLKDPAEYAKFQEEVGTWGRYFIDTKHRAAPARELFSRAVASLGWEPVSSKPNDQEKLNMALKDRAAVAKTTSATKKAPKSKVTESMIAANRLMYPNKTDDEIRKELEPYVK